MGIHNEPGTSRLPAAPTSELVDTVLSKIVDTTDPDRSFVPFKAKGDEVVLLVNNLGGISELEMGGIVNEGGSYIGRTDDSRLLATS
jgi:dihydroxyacetone kinase